jgi:hypothetical protein
LNNDVIYVLSSVCKDLKLLGDDILVDKLLCIFSAVTDIEHPRIDLSLSYVLRDLRKNNKDKVPLFLKTFTDTFNEAIINNVEDPENIALMSAMKRIDYEVDNA